MGLTLLNYFIKDSFSKWPMCTIPPPGGFGHGGLSKRSNRSPFKNWRSCTKMNLLPWRLPVVAAKPAQAADEPAAEAAGDDVHIGNSFGGLET
jgi:hypothetical protein